MLYFEWIRLLILYPILIVCHAVDKRETCICRSARQPFLFSRKVGVCTNDSLPLSLVHQKVHKELPACSYGSTVYVPGVTDIPEELLRPVPKPTTISNVCGAFMSKRGSFQCSKCAPILGKPISCYYVLQSKGTGHMHLTLNLTEIDEQARITIRQGVHGHNLLEDTLKQPRSYTKIARGTTMVIGLELPTTVWPAVSFSFDFETRGDSNVRTGGCGGILRDFQFITNPGYPSRMTKDDVCVWVFYAQTPRVRLEFTSLNMTSIFGSAASLEIYDGDKITDPLLRIHDKESGSPVESTGNAMLIYFHSYLSTSAPGFSAFVRGV